MNKHFQSKLFTNRKHRLTAVMACGILLLGVALYWRSSLLKAQEYTPTTIRSYNPHVGDMRSKNYQLQTQELSPAVK